MGPSVEIVNVVKSGLVLECVERRDHVGDAVFDAEPSIGAAEVGLHPARGHQDKVSLFVAVTCRVTAHEGVQCGLAAAGKPSWPPPSLLATLP